MNRVFTQDNFITIQGFAVVRLGLSGNELILFSLIHGFSQDGETEFKGSLSYIASALNVTRVNAKKILDRLVEKELIIKREIVEDGVKYCRYKINSGVIEKMGGCYQNDNGGVIKTITHNNTSDNNNKPKLSLEEKRKAFADKCEAYVPQYGRKMVDDFVRYWTEANGSKLKCEIARQRSGAFEISRRLATWAGKEYNKPSQPTPQRPVTPKSGKTPWEALGLTYEQYQEVVVKGQAK